MIRRASTPPGHAPSAGPSTPPITGTARRVPPWLFLLVYAISVASLGIAQLGSQDVEITHDGAHYLQIARSLGRGEGFTTYTHWALNLPKGPLPAPDTYRAPLYPLLIAAVHRIDRDLISAGKWATVLIGAFIPPLVLLLAVTRLRLGLRWGLLAAAIATANHHLVIAGSRVLTEAPYSAAVLLALYFLTSPRPAPLRAGLASGIAWLLRYQGVIMIPCALAAYAIGRPAPSVWLRRSAAFSLAFVVTISPWLIRNQRVAGSPFYTELKYHVVSTYDPDRTFYQYFHGLTPPNEPLGYMVKRFDRTVLLFGYRLWHLAEMFGRENAGNPLLLGFAIAGIVFTTMRRRRDVARGEPDDDVFARRSAQILGIYAVLTTIVVSLTFAKHRHLTSCDPLVAIMGAAGFLGALVRMSMSARRRGIAQAVLVGLMVLGITTEIARSYRKIIRVESRGYQDALAAKAFLGNGVAPGEAIMADSPYFFALAFDRPAVSLPWSDDEALRTLALRYNVKYLCLTDDPDRPRHPGSFAASGVLPDWLFEIDADAGTGVRILELDLDRAILAGAVEAEDEP